MGAGSIDASFKSCTREAAFLNYSVVGIEPFSVSGVTVIYMDSRMRLKSPENHNRQADWDAWCPGAALGALIDTPLNPALYETPA